MNKEYDDDLKKSAYQEFWEDLSKVRKVGGSRGSHSVARGVGGERRMSQAVEHEGMSVGLGTPRASGKATERALSQHRHSMLPQIPTNGSFRRREYHTHAREVCGII